MLAGVYGTGGSGGFSPGYRLLSLAGGLESETAVDLQLYFRASGAGTAWAWPEGVLPVLTWGCGMAAGVGCRSEPGTVLLFEPNPDDPGLAWYVDSSRLAQWFGHYVADTGWWSDLDDIAELTLWGGAAARG